MKNFSKILVVSLFLSLTALPTTHSFSDISAGSKYRTAVAELNARGILRGYADGSFRPHQHITRAELLKIAFLGAEVTVQNSSTTDFVDVPKSSWAAPFVQTAQQLKIAHGYAGHRFCPQRSVTRAEAAKIILRSFGAQTSFPAAAPYADVDQGSWVAPYASFIQQHRLWEIPSGNFRPQAPVTRGDAAMLVWNLLKNKNPEAQSQNPQSAKPEIETPTPTKKPQAPEPPENQEPEKPRRDAVGGAIMANASASTPKSTQIALGSADEILQIFEVTPHLAGGYLQKIRLESAGGDKKTAAALEYWLEMRGERLGTPKFMTPEASGDYAVEWQWHGQNEPYIERDHSEPIEVHARLPEMIGQNFGGGLGNVFQIRVAEVQSSVNKIQPGLASNYFVPYAVLPRVTLATDSIFGSQSTPRSQLKIFGFVVEALGTEHSSRSRELQLQKIKLHLGGTVGVTNLRLYDNNDTLVGVSSACRPENSMEETVAEFMVGSEVTIAAGQKRHFYVKGDTWKTAGTSNQSALSVRLEDLGRVTSQGNETPGAVEWQVLISGRPEASSRTVAQNPAELSAPAIIFSAAGGTPAVCH